MLGASVCGASVCPTTSLLILSSLKSQYQNVDNPTSLLINWQTQLYLKQNTTLIMIAVAYHSV